TQRPSRLKVAPKEAPAPARFCGEKETETTLAGAAQTKAGGATAAANRPEKRKQKWLLIGKPMASTGNQQGEAAIVLELLVQVLAQRRVRELLDGSVEPKKVARVDVDTIGPAYVRRNRADSYPGDQRIVRAG